jgi:hypothetical protein
LLALQLAESQLALVARWLAEAPEVGELSIAAALIASTRAQIAALAPSRTMRLRNRESASGRSCLAIVMAVEPGEVHAHDDSCPLYMQLLTGCGGNSCEFAAQHSSKTEQ